MRRARAKKVKEKRKKLFENEAALCAAFTTWARSRGWRIFPETKHDLLMVGTKTTGHQFIAENEIVGVEAKMYPNITVLAQALPNWTRSTGPHFHAVLVPYRPIPEFEQVCLALRIGLIYPTGFGWQMLIYHRHEYPRRVWYPELAAEVEAEAGTPSPRKLTKWKLTAIRLCLHGETKGYLTLRDFAEFGLNPERWIRGGWIRATGKIEVETRLKKYELTTKAPHHVNPEVTAAVRLTQFPDKKH